jgi:hypothetical protein
LGKIIKPPPPPPHPSSFDPMIIPRILACVLVVTAVFALASSAQPWGGFESTGGDGKAARWSATLWSVCMQGTRMQPVG